MLQEDLKISSLGVLPAAKMKVSDLFITLSSALDMGNIEVLDHSRRVAYIVLEIADLLNLNKELKKQIVLAALIHDIGIITYNDKHKAQTIFEVDEDLAESHCKRGADLVRQLEFLPNLSKIILFHHHRWSGGNFNNVKGDKIPLGSRIIHLADRIEAQINPDYYILHQVDSIVEEITAKSGTWFDPALIPVFSVLAKKESFWLNLKSEEYNLILRKWGKETRTKFNLTDLEQVASVVAHLIDRISPFTSRHSSGVAMIAAMIAADLGYNSKEQRAIRIAGLFHDLGKLIVPNKIIEKKGELTKGEYQIIKQHSFYTYRMLNRIEGLGSIPEWAAFHHERLDGTGYPFHIDSKNLNIGSRIMAVSDVFQALTEDRPYRKAFTISHAVQIIEDMERQGKLDLDIIKVLKNAL